MKRKETSTTKRGQGYRIGLRMTLVTLIQQKVLLLPPPIELKGDIKTLSQQIDAITKILYEKDQKRKQYEHSLPYYKDRIVNLVIEESRDEIALKEIVEVFKKNKKELDEIEAKISSKEQEVSLLRKECDEARQLRRNLADINWLLKYYFQISNGHMFLHGAIEHFDAQALNVAIDPEDQEWRAFNLLKMFSEWDISRVMYFLILLEVISDDDRTETNRSYESTPLAKNLFEEVFDGNYCFWYQGSSGKTAEFYSSCSHSLDAWLSKPLAFEDMLTDPIVRAHIETHDAGIKNLKKYYPLFKGGTSRTAQLHEFMLFAKSQVTHKVLTE